MLRRPIAQAVARRLAARHRHQPDRDVPARARGASEPLRIAEGRDRHHRLDPRADVGAQHRSPIRRPRAAWSRSPTRSPSASAPTCGSIASAPAGSRPATTASCAARTTPSILPAASASRRTSPRWWPSCSTRDVRLRHRRQFRGRRRHDPQDDLCGVTPVRRAILSPESGRRPPMIFRQLFDRRPAPTPICSPAAAAARR